MSPTPNSPTPSPPHTPPQFSLCSQSRERRIGLVIWQPLPGKMETDRHPSGFPRGLGTHTFCLWLSLLISHVPQKPLLGTVSRSPYSTYTTVDRALCVSFLSTEPTGPSSPHWGQSPGWLIRPRGWRREGAWEEVKIIGRFQAFSKAK